MHIMFVCTGNTCRSSMAEGLFRRAVENDSELRKTVTVSSAGLAAFDGDPASENAIRVLSNYYNADISSHSSKMITKEDIDRAYLVLTMTRSHKKALLSMYPGAHGKVFTLKEFTSKKPEPGMEEYDFTLDIADPYGMPEEVYNRCARDINSAVERLAEMIKDIDNEL